jgi:type I restriction enzyme M protein
MAKVIGISQVKEHNHTVYDPTCGSGSLLLKAASETEYNVTIYGQEMDNATRALARMNMFLHNHPTAEIRQGNTLSNPLFKSNEGTLATYDFAVSNPPFSSKAWSTGFDPMHDVYERFSSYGIPPAKNGDYAFLLHLVRSLKSTGKGAIILPHGVLFRGNAEGTIRRNIITRGYIKGIIGLPANLFYGTGIPACIIVIDKEQAHTRTGIFMLDASKGFVKDGNKNRLREQDIRRIVDVFSSQTDTPKYARMVPYAEIEQNGYNLNIPRYIDTQEAEDIQDIAAHLQGGIPNSDIDALEKYWAVCTTLKQTLFAASERAGYSQLQIQPDAIQATMNASSEFTHFSQEIALSFHTWQWQHTQMLKQVTIGAKPKELIRTLSDALLIAFADNALIDAYDVYQHLMNYWNDTMQDDVYLIAVGGWKAEITALLNKNGKQSGWTCDLVPKELVIAHYFMQEQTSLAELHTKLETLAQQKLELEEEHSGEEGLLAEVTSDAGVISKNDVMQRLKEIQTNPEFQDETDVLQRYVALVNEETQVKREIKEAEESLDIKLLTQYRKLTEEEIKMLVVDDKWMKALEQAITTELNRVSRRLIQRVKELSERYAQPLPKLSRQVDGLTANVEAHLVKMGFVWQR